MGLVRYNCWLGGFALVGGFAVWVGLVLTLGGLLGCGIWPGLSFRRL